MWPKYPNTELRTRRSVQIAPTSVKRSGMGTPPRVPGDRPAPDRAAAHPPRIAPIPPTSTGPREVHDPRHANHGHWPTRAPARPQAGPAQPPDPAGTIAKRSSCPRGRCPPERSPSRIAKPSGPPGRAPRPRRPGCRWHPPANRSGTPCAPQTGRRWPATRTPACPR